MLQSTSVWEECAALPFLPPPCILLLQSISVEELCAARSFLTTVFLNAAEHLCLRRVCCTSISPSIVYPIAAEHLRWRIVCCTFISYYCVSECCRAPLFEMLQSTSVWEECAALPFLPPPCILLLQSISVEEMCAARSFLTTVFPNFLMLQSTSDSSSSSMTSCAYITTWRCAHFLDWADL